MVLPLPSTKHREGEMSENLDVDIQAEIERYTLISEHKAKIGKRIEALAFGRAAAELLAGSMGIDVAAEEDKKTLTNRVKGLFKST